MIYEQVDEAYQSLANQWHDLAVAFLRLAEMLPDGDPDRLVLNNPAAVPPTGLAYDSDHEVDLTIQNDVGGFSQQAFARVDGQPPLGQAYWNIPMLIAHLIEVFHGNEDFRQTILTDFEALALFNPHGGALRRDQVEVQDCFEELEHLRLYIERVIQDFEELRSDESTRSNIGGLRGSVDHIASYPMLTSELSLTSPQATPSGPGSGSGGTPSSRRLVDTALRDVLGHLPRTRDTRSFKLALQQSFEVQTVEGHSEMVWTPRSYSGQTELGGGVTGAQASLYTRAKVALEHALPLLDGLFPLWPDPDPELVEAARAIVRSELRGVVGELGTEGGPRVARVDLLFASLFDEPIANPRPDQPNPSPVSGHLGYLERVFGLTADQVNTLEEELDVTNFISLRDYAGAVRQSWNTFRQDWLGRDLGTRLVMLSRALAVAAETVEEVNFAMDSVFVGPAERQIAAFRDERGQEVLIGELLSWVITFTSDEAPHLVREAGKRGAAAIIPTAQRLVSLVQRLIAQIPYEPDLPAGLRHPRVIPPLRELQTYLQRIADLSQDLNRPVAHP